MPKGNRETKRVDLTGQQFGRLTVVGFAGTIKGIAYWYCECECGVWSMPRGATLRNGTSTSCGCLKRERVAEAKLVHGGCRDNQHTAEYHVWNKLKHDPARTAPIPFEWNDFRQFFKDVGWKPSPQHEIARHDNRIPHSKENTYWRDPNAEDPIITRPTAVVRLRPVRATGEATREGAGTTEQIPCQV